MTPMPTSPDDLHALSAEERVIYSRVSRRTFMGATAAGTLAALAGREPSLLQAQTAARPKATADAIIVLWMAGGMAQTETFDPKRYTPFEKGVRIADVLSTFPTIDTAVDDIKFTLPAGEFAEAWDMVINTAGTGVDRGPIDAGSVLKVGAKSMAVLRARDLSQPEPSLSVAPGPA